MLKPNDRTPTNSKYIFPPLTTQIPAILTHPQKTFVRFWQKLKRQTKATQLLLCSSAEEPQGLANTKPRTTAYSPHFLPTSPVPPAAGSPSTWCLSDCPSPPPDVSLSAGSPVPTRRAYSSFLLILSTTSGHGSGEQEWKLGVKAVATAGLVCCSQVVQWLRVHLPMQETQEMRVWSLGQEDSLEEEVATCSSIVASKIPQTEEPGRLQSVHAVC